MKETLLVEFYEKLLPEYAKTATDFFYYPQFLGNVPNPSFIFPIIHPYWLLSLSKTPSNSKNKSKYFCLKQSKAPKIKIGERKYIFIIRISRILSALLLFNF